MSRSAGAARRSGDPRKRAVPTPPPATGNRRRAAVVALIAAGGLVASASFALRPADDERDEAARDHAEAACDLTSKAGEAAQVETGARYAAAVLLLDRAIIESARAAERDSGFSDLDEAVQAVHTAGHQAIPAAWQDALDTALAVCHDSVGSD